MNNWKFPPLDPHIAQYVDCYWFLEKVEGDGGHDYPKLNPAPDAHLIIAPNDQPYQYTVNDVVRSGCGSHLILPNTRSVMLNHVDPFVIIGVKFRVGAFYSLVPESALPKLDEVISSLEFLPGSKPPLLGLAQNASTPEEIDGFVTEMDRWLLPMLENAREDKHSQLTRRALALMEDVGIADLADHLDCSRRTIERAFSRVTGLTLKQYESMCTLERLLAYVYEQEDSTLDWADIAAEFGFSDQPHLIRYLKTAIQATPGNYLKQRDLTIDVYGDFE